MCGAVAERRRADFDIPTSLPQVCSHIRGAVAERTRSGSAISWGQWWFGARGFEADVANWVLDPFLAEWILLPLRLRSATAHVWTHVMIYVKANFPPASARACVNVPLVYKCHAVIKILYKNFTHRNPKYFGWTESVPYLLMHWHISLSGHHRTLFWLLTLGHKWSSPSLVMSVHHADKNLRSKLQSKL